MEHHHHDIGAAAPGLAAPERLQVAPQSETPALAGLALLGAREEEHADSDGAAAGKQISTLIACAALAGIEVLAVAADAWLLRQRGRHVGIVHGRLALAAALGGLGLLS